MKHQPLVLLGLLLAAPLPAQLLKNINQLPQALPGSPTDSFPRDFVEAHGRIYFSATTGATGRELFYLDGSGAPAQLLADIAPGADDSNPKEVVALANGRIVFIAENQQYGQELWTSDGTAAGTTLLVDLSGPGEYTLAKDLVVHQGDAYFLARSNGAFSLSLWRTDGTAANTVELDSLGLTGGFSSVAQMLASNGSELFFTASESLGGSGEWRLYRSDGSVGGAQLLASVQEQVSYGPRELRAVAGGCAFVAASIGSGAGTGLEPWVSDGTAAGTSIVDLIPGPDGSNPSDLTVVGNTIFFAAEESSGGGEVFATDCTVAGTMQVTSSTANNARPLYLRAWNGVLAYCADDGVHGNELWVTGALPNSESMFADVAIGATSSVPSQMVPFGNGMMFRATTPAAGTELFFSDGSFGGTVLVRDILPGAADGYPTGLTVFGGDVLFAAEDQVLGVEPFVTDGTAVGTRVHTDIASSTQDQSSDPRGIVSLGDRVVFAADDGWTGSELWVTDGTTAGTTRLTDFNGTGDSLPAGPLRPYVFDGRAFFGLDDGVHGVEPWVTDGTPAGTLLLADVGQGSSNPIPLGEWRGELYFTANTLGSYQWDLLATDGTPAGTRLVYSWAFLGFGNSMASTGFVEHDGRLYFVARTSANGSELWSTDGTNAGTSMVVDLRPGSGHGLTGFHMVSLGDWLYFQGDDAGGNEELWRTDGTAAGTSLFADLNPLTNSSPGGFYRIGDRAVFDAFVNGAWRYFGTDGVTIDQLTSAPLTINGNWRLQSNGERLIGMLRGSNASFELWGTDGTTAGSGVIQQIWPDHTEFANFRAWRVSSGPKLLFLASTAAAGQEIWVTDGTAAGTQLFEDVNPGPDDGSTTEMARVGDTLVFNAWNRSTGYELYRLPFDQLDAWVAEPFGHGCAGSVTGAPRLDTSGSATLGQTLAIELSDGAPNAPVLHFLSPTYRLQDLGDCSLYLDNPVFVTTTAASGSGETTFPVAFPNQPTLAGQSIWLQSMVFDPGGALLDLGALAPALEVRVGN